MAVWLCGSAALWLRGCVFESSLLEILIFRKITFPKNDSGFSQINSSNLVDPDLKIMDFGAR